MTPARKPKHSRGRKASAKGRRLSAKGVVSEFKFDVAFSFLARDLPIARDLADRLTPGLRVFIYERQKEELLGGDGMERFARVFGHETRLAVILQRGACDDKPGWGETDWTAFEEAHIQARAFKTHQTSYMVVRLDDSAPREWIPPIFHLWTDAREETRDTIAGVIRARAREQGAVTRAETASELAMRKSREEAARQAREDHERSYAAVGEVEQERGVLFAAIRRVVKAVQRDAPDLEFSTEDNGVTIAVASPRGSTSLAWYQRARNNVTGSGFKLDDWSGSYSLPGRGPYFGGSGHLGTTYYVPSLSESNEWTWCHAPNFVDSPIYTRPTGDRYRPDEFAEYIVQRILRRIFPDENETPWLIAVIPHR
jgi:hypothetical protein